MGIAADGPLAQPFQAIPLSVQLLRSIGRPVRMKQIPFLDDQQEDQAIDEPQDLTEVVLLRQRPGLQARPKRLVLEVRQEALAEVDQRCLDSTSQVLAGPRSFFPPRIPPGLERTLRDGLPFAPETRLVEQEPQGGEVGVA